MEVLLTSGPVLGCGRDEVGHYARIASERRRLGRPISAFDALIALRHGAAVATRNIADFEHTGVRLLDPSTAH